MLHTHKVGYQLTRAACAVQLARGAVDKRDWPAALEHYTQAVSWKGSGAEFNARMYSNRAWVHLQQGQRARAVADASRASALCQHWWRAYHIQYSVWAGMGVSSLAALVGLAYCGYQMGLC